jgi:hypothetical protein
MNFLIFLAKHIKSYGLFWTLRRLVRLRASYEVLREASKKWCVEDEFNDWFRDLRYNTNQVFIEKICRDFIDGRGVNIQNEIFKMVR